MNKCTGFLLILLALAPAAFGQTIYRSTMPDGRTVIGDRPAHGAKKVEEVYVPPSPPAAAKPAPAAREAVATKPAARTPASALDAAIADLRKAEDALRAAEAAHAAAVEPQDGDRQGVAGGGSRLNEAYFNRQKAAADSVEQARKRVDTARTKVNSLR